METLQWIIPYFFDSTKHFLELLLLIFASFVTIKASFHHYIHRYNDYGDDEAGRDK